MEISKRNILWIPQDLEEIKVHENISSVFSSTLKVRNQSTALHFFFFLNSETKGNKENEVTCLRSHS